MVGTAQPLCLSASETEGRRYDMTMNLGKSEITAPHYNAGLDDEIPSSRRRAVCLDIPFYRTVFSDTGYKFPSLAAVWRPLTNENQVVATETKRILRLPYLDHTKTTVLSTLRSRFAAFLSICCR